MYFIHIIILLPNYIFLGLLLDVARHYLPLNTIKKVIRSLRMHKMNVLIFFYAFFFNIAFFLDTFCNNAFFFNTLVKTQFKQVTIIQSETNLGYAGGCNLGYERSIEPFVLFYNNDTELETNALTEMMAQMRSDESIGALQPKLISFQNKEKFDYSGACGGERTTKSSA